MKKLESSKYEEHEVFMHGLCSQLAKVMLEKYPQLELISVHDTEYRSEFEYDSDYEVLVHMALKMPDGRIVDISNVYNDTKEFERYVDVEFEELGGSFLVENKMECEFMMDKTVSESGTLKEIFHFENPNDDEKAYWSFLDNYFKEVDAIISESNPSLNHLVHQQVLAYFQKVYQSDNGSRCDKILNKNNYSVRQLIFSSPCHVNHNGCLYLRIPTKQAEYPYLVITAISSFVVNKEGKLSKVYALPSDSISQSVNKMKVTLAKLGLNAAYLEITKSMYMSYISPLKKL